MGVLRGLHADRNYGVSKLTVTAKNNNLKTYHTQNQAHWHLTENPHTITDILLLVLQHVF